MMDPGFFDPIIFDNIVFDIWVSGVQIVPYSFFLNAETRAFILLQPKAVGFIGMDAVARDFVILQPKSASLVDMESNIKTFSQMAVTA